MQVTRFPTHMKINQLTKYAIGAGAAGAVIAGAVLGALHLSAAMTTQAEFPAGSPEAKAQLNATLQSRFTTHSLTNAPK